MSHPEFSSHWLVQVRATGQRFVSMCKYKSTDFVDNGNLIPIRKATNEEVVLAMAGEPWKANLPAAPKGDA